MMIFKIKLFSTFEKGEFNQDFENVEGNIEIKGKTYAKAYRVLTGKYAYFNEKNKKNIIECCKNTAYREHPELKQDDFNFTIDEIPKVH